MYKIKLLSDDICAFVKSRVVEGHTFKTQAEFNLLMNQFTMEYKQLLGGADPSKASDCFSILKNSFADIKRDDTLRVFFHQLVSSAKVLRSDQN